MKTKVTAEATEDHKQSPCPTLRLAEDLSMPIVQEIVFSTNFERQHCQQRVSQVVSKMNGLLDYTVDLQNKTVTITGLVDTKNKNKKARWRCADPKQRKKNRSDSCLFRPSCFG
ncbi:hypothetical protein QJS04_geneDACA020975 [Acorus gramineus]|uniref:HMA domain-containing protein n=1 Tax=Acorus gramineus TaxID=55184 RepID=A0AAV9B0W8_ACOGR|nr:hypothetical protein QJS04_geneDACA020975 [Acorus gramineus]